MVTAAAAKKTPAKGRKTPGKKPTPPQVHPDFILSRSIYHELAAAAQELESEINQVEDQIKFIKGDYREDPKKFEMASRVAWSTLDSRAKFVLMNIRDAIEMILDAVIEIDADHEKPDSFTDNFRDFYKKLEGTISIQEKALDGKTLKGVLKDLEKAADLIPSEIGKPSSQGKLRDSIDVMMEIWKTLTGKAPKAPNFETAVPRHNPDQLTMFASSRIARVVARYTAQLDKPVVAGAREIWVSRDWGLVVKKTKEPFSKFERIPHERSHFKGTLPEAKKAAMALLEKQEGAGWTVAVKDGDETIWATYN